MMKGSYMQVPTVGGVTRFDKAPLSGVERSRMTEATHVLTAFNAGDLVPVKCIEVLPSDTYRVNVEEVVRQMTLKVPTMGEMLLDVYAFFVPNRVVNTAWKEVMGENSSGSWTANPVSLAPLYAGSSQSVQIPVGSVADYYGLPTQQALSASVLQLMNDLPFRGYLAIYNEYFRDQNYQPPIPFSKANVYEGFLLSEGSVAGVDGSSNAYTIDNEGLSVADGSFPGGSLLHDVYGEGTSAKDMTGDMSIPARKTSFSALSKPLKVNKLHDALTSVLPSPQRGPQVTFSLVGNAPVNVPSQAAQLSAGGNGNLNMVLSKNVYASEGKLGAVFVQSPQGDVLSNGFGDGTEQFAALGPGATPGKGGETNTYLRAILGSISDLQGTADLSAVTGISVDDLRLGLAMQQLYELYGRSGGRVREIMHSLFGIDVDDPYDDIPRMLGHVRVPLELFQTAQTSATLNDNGDTTPQGNLAGFGYTQKGGFLFHETFLEHGYVHILCCVRQRNLYPSYMDPSWFRVNNLDFYNPVLANISEQPVLLRTINPFGSDPNATVFGYQEAWWEYRQHPDIVTGIMRSGVEGDLSFWTYQDKYNPAQSSADAAFMESNAQEVLDETIMATSVIAPQFKALFTFTFDHEFPGPVYSVPGLDVV